MQSVGLVSCSFCDALHTSTPSSGVQPTLVLSPGFFSSHIIARGVLLILRANRERQPLLQACICGGCRRRWWRRLWPAIAGAPRTWASSMPPPSPRCDAGPCRVSTLDCLLFRDGLLTHPDLSASHEDSRTKEELSSFSSAVQKLVHSPSSCDTASVGTVIHLTSG